MTLTDTGGAGEAVCAGLPSPAEPQECDEVGDAGNGAHQGEVAPALTVRDGPQEAPDRHHDGGRPGHRGSKDVEGGESFVGGPAPSTPMVSLRPPKSRSTAL